MNLSRVFIERPIGTALITLGVALAGAIAWFLLPIAPLPQVEFPTISVSASLPGASPDTMAATVATPLERALGSIAGVNEITSSSSLGSTRITIQFDLDRDIDGAARDVQAALNAARSLLPTGLPGNPQYRKVNPADAPVLIIALTSDTLSRGQMYDAASTVLAQRLSQVDGIGQVTIGGGALPAVRIELDPGRLAASRHLARRRARRRGGDQCQPAEGRAGGRRPLLAARRQRPGAQRRRVRAAGDRLRRRRRAAPARRGRGRSTACRTCATTACRTAGRRCC